MPRKPRIHFDGAVYHVILRGNAGQDIFTGDADRSRFLLLLQQGVERYRCMVHAYCLMDNHVHLAIQVCDIPLSKLMQVVGFRYTQYMNCKFKRTGHLFQGRFKALLIDQDNYLLQLVRYIHLNPYRARMIQHPDQYSWSSHPVYTGELTIPWLTMDWVLEQLGTERKTAILNYITFINDGVNEGHDDLN
ncbi:MAG: transposase [Desulfuromonas sp.]|nr:transposase [Desulfuromonas sp.]